MKKPLFLSLSLLFSPFLLSSCAAIAKAQMQQQQLADGSTVSIDRITPTAKWNCRQIGSPLIYTPELVQAEEQSRGCYNSGNQNSFGAFLTNAACANRPHREIIKDVAVYYANLHHIKANYINIQVPPKDTATIFGNTYDKTNGAPIYASYYQCQYLNPDNKVYAEEKSSTTVGFD